MKDRALFRKNLCISMSGVFFGAYVVETFMQSLMNGLIKISIMLILGSGLAFLFYRADLKLEAIRNER